MTFRFAVALSAVCISGAAAAQTVAETVTLPEISVTARKREEQARDVPFALTATDRQTIEDARIEGVEDLYRNVPNFNYNGYNDSRTSYYQIRGVGPLSQPLSPDDTSVVTYVDGVPQPLYASDIAYLDIERIEVLRGPQGTLYGRNTSAGAINIVTRKATGVPDFMLRAEYASQKTRMAEGSAGGALVPGKLAARLGFRYWGASGFVPNLYGSDRGGYDNYALRGSFVLTPSDRTTVTLGVYGEADYQRPPISVLLQQPTYPSVAVTQGSESRRMTASSLTIAHDLGWAVLNALTGFNTISNTLRTDDADGLVYSRMTGLPPQIFATTANDYSRWNERETTVSQEVRLNSPEGSDVAWVGGANYYYDRFLASYYNESFAFAATNGSRTNQLTTNSLSVFGEVTVPVTDRLKLTGGLRYSYDWKDYDAGFIGNGYPGTVGSFNQSGRLTYSYLTGRAAAAYDVLPQSTAYVTAGRGYKAGGFPRFTTDAAYGQASTPYQPATSWTYEAGLKNRFLGGRARLDLAVFYNDVKNEQLYAVDPASFTFRPANTDVRSYGFEAEGAARILPGLDLTGTLGFTNATLRNVASALAVATGAANGNDVPNVPRLGASIALQYRGDLGLPAGLNWLGRIEDQYQGGRYADVGNRLKLDSYHVVNARLGLEFERGDAYVFVNNLFDKQYQYGGNQYAPGIDAVIPARGRVVGVGASLRF